MYQVGSDLCNLVIPNYKYRKEDDYYIVFFPELGRYYATNEVGIDILSFFQQDLCNDLFAFLTKSYGELDERQQNEVRSFIHDLNEIIFQKEW